MLHLPPLLHRGIHDLFLGRIGPLPIFPKYRVPGWVRTTHMHVIGITGKGKSKLLESCLVQDIQAGRGCILIDPHSDLANNTLRHCLSQGILMERDAGRVIYFDPTRQDEVIPFNVLATSGDPYETAIRIVEAFRRTWPESLREAPHFSNVATAALILLVEQGLTLIDMHRLLTDHEWRNQLLNRCQHPEVVSFFHDRYDRWGRNAPALRESTLNKVAAFTFNPHLRRVLGQRENHIDLRRVMDEGLILLVDLGRCDGETRRLLGSLLVTGLEQAAAGRHDLPSAQRRPCYAYIDEFQDFAANPGSVKSLAQILSECRKFGLHLTLAHQSLSQLSPRMMGALGNIQTRIIFGIARQDAEFFAHEIGRVDDSAIKHEAQTDTQHPVYAPLTEQWENWTMRLKSQPPRQAMVAGWDGSVSRIWTLPIPRYSAGTGAVKAFQTASAKFHGAKIETKKSQPDRLRETKYSPLPSPGAIVPVPL